MNFSIYDTRPLSDKEEDLRSLDAIQAILEDSIADYALENPENLYDEDNQEILRKLVFAVSVQGARHPAAALHV